MRPEMDKVELTRAVLLGLYAIRQYVNFHNDVLITALNILNKPLTRKPKVGRASSERADS